MLGLTLLGACQTTQTAPSGNLSTYEGVEATSKMQRAAVRQRRDDQASDVIQSVFIRPSILAANVGSALKQEDQQAVLYEVDRQLCYELSRRFPIVSIADEQAAEVRTVIVRLEPTNQLGSGASAVAQFFNPLPLNVRAPGSTGGLGIESELLVPNSGQQIAAITWARDATPIGTESPSFSRVGDALQLAQPASKAVADAFATKTRKSRKIAKPDPCQAFGPRFQITSGTLVGAVTGLYMPPNQPGQSSKRTEADTPK